MLISFRLKDIHMTILASMALTGFEERGQIVRAALIIGQTKHDYVEVLKWSAKPEYADLSSPAGGEINREISALEALELVKWKRPKLVLTEEGRRVAAAIVGGRFPIIRPAEWQRDSIFIASAFGYEDVDVLFRRELAPACERLGFKAVRVDRSEPRQTITSAILEGIRISACVLADLTNARPSVYFEIGMAQGLGIPIVLTCRQDHYRGSGDSARVHFDLEQYKISFWSKAADGAFTWAQSMHPVERLRAAVGEFRAK